jgi:hypothetical protein
VALRREKRWGGGTAGGGNRREGPGQKGNDFQAEMKKTIGKIGLQILATQFELIQRILKSKPKIEPCQK